MVEGYRRDKDEDPDHWMGLRLDGDRCYPVGGSSGSPVYGRRGERTLGVGVLFGADTAEGCSRAAQTAKIVAVSTMGDVLARSGSYAPFFRAG